MKRRLLSWLGIEDPRNDELAQRVRGVMTFLASVRLTAIQGERWIEGEHFHAPQKDAS